MGWQRGGTQEFPFCVLAELSNVKQKALRLGEGLIQREISIMSPLAHPEFRAGSPVLLLPDLLSGMGKKWRAKACLIVRGLCACIQLHSVPSGMLKYQRATTVCSKPFGLGFDRLI